MGTSVVEVRAVGKTFGKVAALTGVDLTIERGSITALLGPNGAGKTTLVRILATLVRPDAGWARVAGYDVVADPYAVRARIGLTGQYAGLDGVLSGRDNLLLVGRLAGLGRARAAARAAELLERFDLAGAAHRAVGTYSGGMRRRVDLAASLMARPVVLVLDEPTTGLDPGARRMLWEILDELRAEGTTMLLTTQYLEEADRLADTVHVIDHGRVVATGTPGQLKAATGSQVVVARFEPADRAVAAGRLLAAQLSLPEQDLHLDAVGGVVTVAARRGVGSLVDIAETLRRHGVDAAEIGLRQPSLDDAFLALTHVDPRERQSS